MSASGPSSAPVITPTVRHQGRLVFPSDGTAFDLDSRAANWTPSRGVASNGIQDIEYVAGFDNQRYSGFLFTGSPWSVALLGKNAPQDWDSCHSVNYGGDGNAKHLTNYPAGAAIGKGRAICLHTPAGNTALLQIESVPASTVTVHIIAWAGD